MRSAKPAAFSLVELLIVIGVIALLISILLPVIGRARESARRTACMSNLRQIGLGLVIYVNDHKGTMPSIGERYFSQGLVAGLEGPVTPGGPGRGKSWMGLLQNYSRTVLGTLVCPSDPRLPSPNQAMFTWTPASASELLAWTDSNPRSYSAVIVGLGLSTRRVPWSAPSVTPNGVSGLEGAVRITSLRPATEFHLVWDGHSTIVTTFAGAAALKSGYNASIAGGSNWHYHQHTFRHSPRDRRPGMAIGPNALCADGHVETTVNIFKLTDDNFSYLR